jgi:hypothetical protein
MDWSEQYEEMMNTWTETQKKLWEDYSQTVKDLGKSESQKAWERTVELGQQGMKNTFQAQAQAYETLVDNMKTVQGIPEQATENLQQFKEMGERWRESQIQFWDGWFEMLKNFDPSKSTGPWGEMPTSYYQSWQDSINKFMQTQSEWMDAWTKVWSGKPSDE